MPTQSLQMFGGASSESGQARHLSVSRHNYVKMEVDDSYPPVTTKSLFSNFMLLFCQPMLMNQ
jgi:hypothetical protein